jgi:DNA-binding NarL/FixJ family response regulator
MKRKKVSLLMVENNSIMIEATIMLYDMSKDFQFEYFIVKSETEMNDFLENNKVDLVLCDFRLLSNEGLLNIPNIQKKTRMVIRENLINDNIIKQGLMHGASCVHAKGMEANVLFSMYKQVLEGKIFEFEELKKINNSPSEFFNFFKMEKLSV